MGVTRIGVKLRRIRNLYVLVVFAPGSRREIFTRRVVRHPFPPPVVGDVVRKLRVTAVSTRVERRGQDGELTVEHIVELYTRGTTRKRSRRRVEPPSNVVAMPTGDGSVVAEFIRYHVLVRVFGGDPDAWLAHLKTHGDAGGDVRFVRWIRSRLRQDPALLASIVRMVDATPFWRVAEA